MQIAGTAAAPDLKDMKAPAAWTKPQIEFPAHQAQLGMTFCNGKMRADRFIVLPANPDDSGSVDYRATHPVIGMSWRASPITRAAPDPRQSGLAPLCVRV